MSLHVSVILSTEGGCAPVHAGMHTPLPPGPEAGIPLGAVHAGKYGQQVGSTHPTGMHSCYCPQKQNLGQGNIFAPVCHSVHRRGVWFGGCLFPGGVWSQWGPPSLHPRGKLRGDQVQAHTQGGNWGGSDPGPHPRGKLRGDQIQAHTQGGNWGGSGPGQHPRGKFRGIRTSPPDDYCCGRYASYWNAFLLAR